MLRALLLIRLDMARGVANCARTVDVRIAVVATIRNRESGKLLSRNH